MNIMIALTLAALLDPVQAVQTTLSASDQKQIDAAIASSHPAGEMRLVAMDAERGVAEFMAVCVRPMWDMAQTTEAAARSDLTYTQTVKTAGSGRWFAKRGYLALEEVPSQARVGEEGLPQCQLSLGTIQPRTSLQLAQVLKAALDVEMGRDLPILQNDGNDSYLEWNADGTASVTNRVTVEGESTPGHSITYLFERWTPHGIAFRKEMIRRWSEAKK